MAIYNGKNIKELIWKVVSDKMDKSIVVVVERVKMHPIFKKRFVVQKKYYVHDENNISKIWQNVKFRQSKPISKLKRWALIEIL